VQTIALSAIAMPRFLKIVSTYRQRSRYIAVALMLPWHNHGQKMSSTAKRNLMLLLTSM
jgi:hypothetical protein